LANCRYDLESFLPGRSYPEQTITALVPVRDIGERANIEYFCRTDFTTASNQNNTELFLVLQAFADHIEVALLEYPQR
jgi:hypothetical protein